MCGIAGIVDLNAVGTRGGVRACEDTLDRMLYAIFHRGPDDSGKLVEDEIAMGMRRLSIIDLADGQQPIFDESGRYGVVFNGEIYNYRELRSELVSRGHQFRTNSDTEVIVHLFEDHGSKCVDHLRGMFAFAVWDRKERSLFIARDRLGIKPLYYWANDEKLVFGSEIKSLLQVEGVPRELDRRALSQYLSLKYVPAPRTLFQNVRCLLPGHTIEVKNGHVEIKRYWDLPFSDETDPRSENELTDDLEEKLSESVRLRLRSDVPFGAFLSGGVDSSLIVALMSKHLQQPVKTFSVGFGENDGEEDELPYAKIVGDRFGCEQHTLRITSKHFLEHAEKVLWHLDQPIADQATVATHMVSALARKHVKMVLTGEGGDELFAGYARYRGEKWSRYSTWLPRVIAPRARSVFSALPGMRRAKIAINALSHHDEATRYANWFPMFSDDSKAALLSSWREATEGAAEVFQGYLNRCSSKDPLSRMLYCDSKAWLVDYLLLRGDKLTMANSLEARVPLLDHHVVEFASRIPSSMKLNGNGSKYLLKKVAARYLPEEIIQRPKKGFPIPIDRWLRNEARELVRDTLSPSSLQSRGLFDADYVERLIARHESGYADLSTEIWGLVSVEMWMRQFLDQRQQPKQQTPSVSGAV